jgi:hypothetical protein
MHRFKVTAKIDHLLEHLEHAFTAARHDANVHAIDASHILRHLQAARENMLEAVKELEKLIGTVDKAAAEPTSKEEVLSK